MVLFDISSFPKGMDLYSWFDLYKQGLVLYDSTIGNPPLKIIDKEDIALVDINSMANEDLIVVAEHINKLNEKLDKKNKEERDVVYENNQKLIKYLNTINNE